MKRAGLIGFFLLAVIACATLGCSVREMVPNSGTTGRTGNLGRVRITRHDKTTIYFDSTHVMQDSVVGLVRLPGGRDAFQRAAVALRDVEMIQKERFHAGKTMLYLAGLILVLGAVIAATSDDFISYQ